jgi:hypothetical protein
MIIWIKRDRITVKETAACMSFNLVCIGIVYYYQNINLLIQDCDSGILLHHIYNIANFQRSTKKMPDLSGPARHLSPDNSKAVRH